MNVEAFESSFPVRECGTRGPLDGDETLRRVEQLQIAASILQTLIETFE